MGKKVILVLLSITPLPQKQSYLKDKPLIKRFGIIALFYFARKACVFHARLLNDHFVFF